MGYGYNYHCKKCGKPMTAVDVESEDAPALKCLECGADLSKPKLRLFWD